jgi:hypothetical protein
VISPQSFPENSRCCELFSKGDLPSGDLDDIVTVDCHSMLGGATMPSHQFFVFSNPMDGQEREFNEWYESQHLPDVLAVPGVIRAQRYALAPTDLPDNEVATIPPPAQSYLVVYDVDRDPSEVMNAFMSRVLDGTMSLSPALDLASVSMGFWTPIGESRLAST